MIVAAKALKFSVSGIEAFKFPAIGIGQSDLLELFPRVWDKGAGFWRSEMPPAPAELVEIRATVDAIRKETSIITKRREEAQRKAEEARLADLNAQRRGGSGFAVDYGSLTMHTDGYTEDYYRPPVKKKAIAAEAPAAPATTAD